MIKPIQADQFSEIEMREEREEAEEEQIPHKCLKAKETSKRNLQKTIHPSSALLCLFSTHF